ncbi:Hypothetical predicted protein [Paramuricea clavata]|nr:Hypothetical predicted protein [Paramuricea clavata]
MSGASAISSADLFGEEQRSGQRGASLQSPEMYQLREGIGRMTEKISNVASGVLSTIQDRYNSGYNG